MPAPLCRYCGKPIGKKTTPIQFARSSGFVRDARPEMPVTKEDVQRLLNERVISVRYYTASDGRKLVSSANIWDGESYEDEHFCTNEHAIAFARSVLNSHPDLGSLKYFTAIDARDRKNG